MKTCTRCHEQLAPTAFVKNRSRADGLSGWCRTCLSRRNAETQGSARAYRKSKAADPERFRRYTHAGHLMHRYGLTVAEYDAMVERQGGRCAVCDVVPNYRLFVDHDHESGRVCGLLCSKCNGALGWLEKRRDRIESYLMENVNAR